MPRGVWGHTMSRSSVALQKRSGRGKDSRGGGGVVLGTTGGALGAPLLPSFSPVLVVVLAPPQCSVVVVVAAVVVLLWGCGDEVACDSGGAAETHRICSQTHKSVEFPTPQHRAADAVDPQPRSRVGPVRAAALPGVVLPASTSARATRLQEHRRKSNLHH